MEPSLSQRPSAGTRLTNGIGWVAVALSLAAGSALAGWGTDRAFFEGWWAPSVLESVPCRRGYLFFDVRIGFAGYDEWTIRFDPIPTESNSLDSYQRQADCKFCGIGEEMSPVHSSAYHATPPDHRISANIYRNSIRRLLILYERIDHTGL